VTKRYNLYTWEPTINVPGKYEQRMYKYSKRGFAVAIPGFDISKVPESDKLLRDTQGVEKLLMYNKIASRPHKHYVIDKSSDIDTCVNEGALWCRHCRSFVDRDEIHQPKIAQRFAKRPIKWEKQGSVYQDFEKTGNQTFRRQLGSDSWVARINEWDEGVYKSSSTQPISEPPLVITSSDSQDNKFISDSTKLLQMVAYCFKSGKITSEERGLLKELILTKNKNIHLALKKYEISQNQEDLLQAFKVLCL